MPTTETAEATEVRTTGDAPTTAELVAGARGGDPTALVQLVRRFEGPARRRATARLAGDLAAGSDAAQEAIVEVIANLERLRDDAAFPGFLMAAVTKYADRITRRRRPSPVPDAVLHAAITTTADDPAEVVRTRHRAAAVHAVLADASGQDRTVLSLRHLLSWSIADIAEALELPASTVKKRLHDARRRLRPQLRAALETDVSFSEPPSDAARLALLSAVERRDVAAVAALLATHPVLVDTDEIPRVVGASARRTAVRAGYRVLHRVAATGELPLARLLLDHGANHRVRAADGETPLHSAALSGHAAVVAALLRSGADPHATTGTGMTPLHWAQLHDQSDAADVLAAAGADPHARDRSGRTPQDWADVRAARRADRWRAAGHSFPADPTDHGTTDQGVTMDDVTDLIGRCVTADGSALDDGDDLDLTPPDGSPHARGSGWLPTGIRAIDLAAPLVRGGTVELRGDEGGGHVVLMAEVASNLHAADGTVLVTAGRSGHATGAAHDLRDAIAPLGLAGHTTSVVAGGPDGQDCLMTAQRIAATLVGAGTPVLLAVESDLTDIAPAIATAGLHDRTALTLMIIAVERDGIAPDPCHADSTVVLSRHLGASGLWPAVDVLACESRLLHDGSLESRHLDLAQRLRAATSAGAAAQQIVAQPFGVAEPHTGVPGEVVTPTQLRGLALAWPD